MSEIRIAIIGGSGLYELLEEAESRIVETPFGKSPRIDIGVFGEKRVAFLARHAKPGSMEVKHEVPPHMINYRANILALKRLGVKAILATNACGSLKREYKPGDILIPDQLIDMTKNRDYTFYDGSVTPKELIGEGANSTVIHIDFTHPYCPSLRAIIIDAAKSINLKVHEKGCYVCTEGPRFETPAEIKFFSLIGVDVVGMTSVPEAILARELNMCYASICIITNYAAGMQERISQEEVRGIFNKARDKVYALLEEAVRRIPRGYVCRCHEAVQ